MNREKLEDEIKSCTRCSLSSNTTPVPFAGPAPAKLAVLAEAPGRTEAKEGRPLVGPAGKLLQEALREAKLAPKKIARVNTVCCWPIEQGSGRTPRPEEIAACASLREAQLRLIQPRYLLVLGSVALGALRDDVKISRARGRPFVREDVLVLPTFHPAAGLRNGTMKDRMFADIRTLADMIRHVDKATKPTAWWDALAPYMLSDCVACGGPLYRFDNTGYPWCQAHWQPPGIEGEACVDCGSTTVFCRTWDDRHLCRQCLRMEGLAAEKVDN